MFDCSFGLLAFATFLKLVDVIIHLLIPTPDAKVTEAYVSQMKEGADNIPTPEAKLTESYDILSFSLSLFLFLFLSLSHIFLYYTLFLRNNVVSWADRGGNMG